MGQLSLIVLLLIAFWLGWRSLRRERNRIVERLRETDRKGPPVTTLEKDPKTGVYRPVDRRD